MKSRFLPPLAAFLFLATLALAPIGAAHSQTRPAYLALGDSLAFGVGADNPATQGYVGLTADALRQTDAYSAGLDVVNLSVPGATSADLLAPGNQLEQALATIEAGDVAIVSIDIGANDLLGLAEGDSLCLQAPSSKACLDELGTTLGQLDVNLSEALQQMQTAAPNASYYVVDLYNPYSGTADSREVIASVGVQQVNGVLSAVASRFSATLVDVRDVFEGRGKQWVASDGIHPNNDGYRVMAEALLAAIQERTPVLPSDLVALPSASAGAVAAAGGDSGVDVLVPAVGIPAAFAAGLLLSAAYFVVLGRSRP